MSHWGGPPEIRVTSVAWETILACPLLCWGGLLSGVSWVIDAGMVLLKDDIYMKGSDSEKNKTAAKQKWTECRNFLFIHHVYIMRFNKGVKYTYRKLINVNKYVYTRLPQHTVYMSQIKRNRTWMNNIYVQSCILKGCKLQNEVLHLILLSIIMPIVFRVLWISILKFLMVG